MKKTTLIFFFLTSRYILANPIDGTPAVKFSELLFDKYDNWAMELFFYPYTDYGIDSVFVKSSKGGSKLKLEYNQGRYLAVINSDSLETPININRNGDIIEITTFSNNRSTRWDQLIFGNQPNATVGRPVEGYSIMRNTWEDQQNTLTIDCLTKNPSLGELNSVKGLTGTLKGNIYDTNNEPVTKLKVFPASGCYFELETSLKINPDGTYSTMIFRRFDSELKDHLTVKMHDFEWFKDTVFIEPFELKNMHPDTVVFQDIYLKSNDYIVTSVNNNTPQIADEFELINYPNPFNSSTNFFIKIPQKLKSKPGNISIYNINGELLKNISLENNKKISWDGTSINGSSMPTGIYYYRLSIENQIMKSGSMILLK